jgi:hypothetical protein
VNFHGFTDGDLAAERGAMSVPSRGIPTWRPGPQRGRPAQNERAHASNGSQGALHRLACADRSRCLPANTQKAYFEKYMALFRMKSTKLRFELPIYVFENKDVFLCRSENAQKQALFEGGVYVGTSCGRA